MHPVNVDEERRKAFLAAMEYLEQNDEENVSITFLCNIMKEQGVEPYVAKRLKKQILNISMGIK